MVKEAHVQCQECGEIMTGKECVQHIKEKHPNKTKQDICWELMMEEQCSGEGN